jgi:hypothetical protein
MVAVLIACLAEQSTGFRSFAIPVGTGGGLGGCCWLGCICLCRLCGSTLFAGRRPRSQFFVRIEAARPIQLAGLKPPRDFVEGLPDGLVKIM